MARRARADDSRGAQAFAVRRAAAFVVALASACSTATPNARAPGREATTCQPLKTPTAAWDEALLVEPATSKIVFVTVEGARRVPRSIYAAAIESRAGAELDPVVVRSDLRRLLALEVLSDARAEARSVDGGVVLSFVLSERPPIHAIHVRGVPSDPTLRPIVPSPGEPYDAAQITRQADFIRQALRHKGFLDATTRSGGARRPDGSIDVCIEATPRRRYVVGRILFQGNEMLSDETLTAALFQDDSDAMANRPGEPPRPDLLVGAHWRLEAPYFDRGMLDAQVTGPQLVKHPAEGTADLRFSVKEGPVFHVGKVSVSGVSKRQQKKLLAAFGLETGSIAKRTALREAVDRVRELTKREVDVTTNFDAEKRHVDLELEVIPQ